MKKIIALALIGLALTGCIEQGDDLTNHHQTITVCLDGVEYWVLSADSQSQALAPKVDPVTLTFVRCK